MRSTWGPIPPEFIEPLRYQSGPDGSFWLVRRFLTAPEMVQIQGKQERPKDPPEGWPHVTVSRRDLQKEFRLRKQTTSGRKPDYDWPWIEQQAYEHFDSEGCDRQSEIEHYMAVTAEKRHGRSPTESNLRTHARKVWQRLHREA